MTAKYGYGSHVLYTFDVIFGMADHNLQLKFLRERAAIAAVNDVIPPTAPSRRTDAKRKPSSVPESPRKKMVPSMDQADPFAKPFVIEKAVQIPASTAPSAPSFKFASPDLPKMETATAPGLAALRTVPKPAPPLVFDIDSSSSKGKSKTVQSESSRLDRLERILEKVVERLDMFARKFGDTCQPETREQQGVTRKEVEEMITKMLPDFVGQLIKSGADAPSGDQAADGTRSTKVDGLSWTAAPARVGHGGGHAARVPQKAGGAVTPRPRAVASKITYSDAVRVRVNSTIQAWTGSGPETDSSPLVDRILNSQAPKSRKPRAANVDEAESIFLLNLKKEGYKEARELLVALSIPKAQNLFMSWRGPALEVSVPKGMGKIIASRMDELRDSIRAADKTKSFRIRCVASFDYKKWIEDNAVRFGMESASQHTLLKLNEMVALTGPVKISMQGSIDRMSAAHESVDVAWRAAPSADKLPRGSTQSGHQEGGGHEPR
jgi:hypothetical protein